MRIAIFTDTYTPEINGVARTLERFAHYLESRDVSFIIFAPYFGTDLPPIPHLERFNSLPFFLYPESRITLPNPIRIKQALHAFNPSIIHVATPFNLGLYGLNYGKKQHIPMVASYHTNFDEYLDYYNLPFLKKWIWTYMKWFHRLFAKVFVPSRATKQKLLDYSIHSNLEIWPRGVDHGLYSPAKRNRAIFEPYGIDVKDNQHVLLYVGRLAPEKDIQVAIDAFYALPEPLRKECHFIVAGDGPLFHSLSGQDHPQITFTGFVKGEALAQLYASSDLLLFPSSTETFGNVVLEAHSSGIPVVGANAGGVQEIVKDGVTGKLCVPHEPDGFTKAVQAILENPELLASMKKEARRLALTYSWDEIFSSLLSQYKEVIDSSNSENRQHSA